MLISQSFDGDFGGFRNTFDDYLTQWSGKDPFGRKLLEKAMTEFGTLAFQSMSTDRQYLDEQTNLRWKAWLEILPLDMQLGMLLFNWDRHMPCPKFSWFHWNQLHELEDKPAPEKAFRLSPLGGWLNANRPGLNSPSRLSTRDDSGKWYRLPSTWPHFRKAIHADIHSMVNLLVSFQKWDEADDLMSHARVSAWAPVTNVMVCYRVVNSYGSLRVQAVEALPLWSAALFAGSAASDPMFWKIMAKHGGPTGPCVGPSWSDPARQEALAKGQALAPPHFDNAIEWLTIPKDSFVPPEASVAIQGTCAVWRAQLMESKLESVSLVGRGPRI